MHFPIVQAPEVESWVAPGFSVHIPFQIAYSIDGSVGISYQMMRYHYESLNLGSGLHETDSVVSVISIPLLFKHHFSRDLYLELGPHLEVFGFGGQLGFGYRLSQIRFKPYALLSWHYSRNWKYRSDVFPDIQIVRLSVGVVPDLSGW
jgi:hypothetical protein